MEFFRIRRDIPFMRHALVFNIISAVTFVIAVVFLAVRGLNLGVDFRGGTVIEVTYAHAVDFNRVRAALDTLQLGEYSAQSFGSSTTALIRLPLKEGTSTAALSERVMNALRADDPSARQQRVEFVGPQVGKELFENGALALLLVSFGIMTSMFSAVFVSRGIVNLIYGSQKKLERISIGQVWKPTTTAPVPAK